MLYLGNLINITLPKGEVYNLHSFLDSIAAVIQTQADNLDFNTWTLESYDAAVKNIYSFVLKYNNVTADWNNVIYELCRERIALAGYRLAKLISTIYA
jgi:hypothetical protein